MSDKEANESNQFLTFILDGEVFALDIRKIREVLDFTTVTKVPQTPDFLRGVINLRGSVVPVVDLRLKFGLPVAEQTVHTCIIIVEVLVEADTVILGVIADSVQEVLELDPEQIQPPPKIGSRLDVGFLRGMGRRGDDFIMIVDMDAVFSAADLGAARELPQSPQAA